LECGCETRKIRQNGKYSKDLKCGVGERCCGRVEKNAVITKPFSVK
jgi:hypothetical protein